MRRSLRRAAAIISAFILLATAAYPAPAAEGWIETSNEHASLVLDVLAEFRPEAAAGLAVDGCDEFVSVRCGRAARQGG